MLSPEYCLMSHEASRELKCPTTCLHKSESRAMSHYCMRSQAWGVGKQSMCQILHLKSG